jgi:hypothetical protein
VLIFRAGTSQACLALTSRHVAVDQANRRVMEAYIPSSG